jgi:hypothetical protein
MPTLRQAKQVVAQKAIPAPVDGVQVIAIIGDFVVPTGLVVNDVIEMGGLPADCVPVNLIVSTEDMDSNGTPLITLDAGIISGNFGALDNARTCGNEFFAASTVGQAGGIQAMNKAAGAMLAPSTSDRGWGLKVAAAAATLTVGAKVRAVLFVAAKPLTT